MKTPTCELCMYFHGCILFLFPAWPINEQTQHSAKLRLAPVTSPSSCKDVVL